jgi:hypothetical protein
MQVRLQKQQGQLWVLNQTTGNRFKFRFSPRICMVVRARGCLGPITRCNACHVARSSASASAGLEHWSSRGPNMMRKNANMQCGNMNQIQDTQLSCGMQFHCHACRHCVGRGPSCNGFSGYQHVHSQELSDGLQKWPVTARTGLVTPKKSEQATKIWKQHLSAIVSHTGVLNPQTVLWLLILGTALVAVCKENERDSNLALLLSNSSVRIYTKEGGIVCALRSITVFFQPYFVGFTLRYISIATLHFMTLEKRTLTRTHLCECILHAYINLYMHVQDTHTYTCTHVEIYKPIYTHIHVQKCMHIRIS